MIRLQKLKLVFGHRDEWKRNRNGGAAVEAQLPQKLGTERNGKVFNPKSMNIQIETIGSNEAAGLEATLEALQPLRLQGADVIVVDGGSIDESVALATPLADKVISGGPGRARQR